MRVSSAAPSDQQMKEICQEMTRLQIFGNFISTLRQMEEDQIQLKSESVKVGKIPERKNSFKLTTLSLSS